jgi:glycosyltransferase involved in cell wall biosynthesis
MYNPLVSIIVPTRNSSSTLEDCLRSIKEQSYKNIEIIVVDNNSIDNTKKIAQKYTNKVFNFGPERSAQTNYGVEQANGFFVYKVDSDFILEKEVVNECVNKIKDGFDDIIVHNSPDIRVSWIAKVRKFEVDMYKYDITYSSARFVKKEIYQKIGGFNEKITAGEDYDFQNKLNKYGFKTGFIKSEALHLGEPVSFWKHMIKYYKYGKDFVNYTKYNKKESFKHLFFLRSVYIKNWKFFIIHPLLGISFIFYHFLKFGFGGVGYIVSKINKKNV